MTKRLIKTLIIGLLVVLAFTSTLIWLVPSTGFINANTAIVVSLSSMLLFFATLILLEVVDGIK